MELVEPSAVNLLSSPAFPPSQTSIKITRSNSNISIPDSAFDGASSYDTPNFLRRHVRRASSSSIKSLPSFRLRPRLSLSHSSSFNYRSKSKQSLSSDSTNRIHISWNQAHQLIYTAVHNQQIAETFRPDVIVVASVSLLSMSHILIQIMQSYYNRSISLVSLRIVSNTNPDFPDLNEPPSYFWNLLDPGILPVLSTDSRECPLDFLGKNVLIFDAVNATGHQLSLAIEAIRNASEKLKGKSSTPAASPTIPPLSVVESAAIALKRQKSSSSIMSSKTTSKTNPDREELELPLRTRIGVFVLHDKLIQKKADIAQRCEEGRTYFSAGWVPSQMPNLSPSDDTDTEMFFDDAKEQGKSVEPPWIVYPWEAVDLDEHNNQSEIQSKLIPSAYPSKLQSPQREGRYSFCEYHEDGDAIEVDNRIYIMDSTVKKFAATMQNMSKLS
ncbi:hypothetical protein HK098_006208 [Nowakowskiella sp. JEL0407]|nr:hypothetical protein HK098_006208 [Nowakowskiella sp. JEL0407]